MSLKLFRRIRDDLHLIVPEDKEFERTMEDLARLDCDRIAEEYSDETLLAFVQEALRRYKKKAKPSYAEAHA